MMKVLLFLPLLPAAALAQFQWIEITFDGVGCASCVESLPARMQRMRGVESAKVDAAKGTLQVRLAAENRVRVEQVRDAIEQDGTKVRRAVVSIRGVVAGEGGAWTLKAALLPAYGLRGDKLQPGSSLIDGDVVEVRPSSGPLTISVRQQKLLP